MKLRKVALWKERKMYYVLDSKYVLDRAILDSGLRVSSLSSEEEFQDRIKNCSLLQKQ